MKMNNFASNFTAIFVLILQTAFIFPVLAAEDGIYSGKENDKYSQIYLSGHKEGEFFWKYEDVFTCPESSFDSKLGGYRTEDCTPHSVGICQKVYRLKDGSLASRQTCQESCVREINKPAFTFSSCTLF